jgi:hypothetical protein
MVTPRRALTKDDLIAYVAAKDPGIKPFSRRVGKTIRRPA